MAPPTDYDNKLLVLQGKVAFLRQEHASLVERERVCRVNKYVASADDLKRRADATFAEFQEASKKLAAYISKKQRGLK